MDSRTFAEQFLLNEVEKMKAAQVRLHLLSAMVHGIETAGALLDTLPFKAKGQGRNRFSLALRKLFPAEYTRINQQFDLYGQLRSHLSHCMLPATTIKINPSNDDHLTFETQILTIGLDALYDDYHTAISKLIAQLDAGNLKNKKIMFDGLSPITE